MAKDMAKFRKMSADALDNEEHGLREEVWKLRLQMTTGQLQDPQKVQRAKKDLARVLTVKRELELQATRKSGS